MPKKIILLLICALFFQLTNVRVLAVRAYPYPFTVTQPDGTKLTLRLQGDEFHHSRTTEDGYLIKKNAKGFFTYATKNAAGKFVASDFVARDVKSRTANDINFLKSIQKASDITSSTTIPLRTKMMTAQTKPQRAYPMSGTPKSLVILVYFSDNNFVTPDPETSFTNLLNETGYSDNGGTGSAKDYFKANSYGQFSPEFDVVGPYKLHNNMAYYGANDANGYDVRPDYMIAEACALADSAGVDFAQYDTDNDGFVDNVFVYYAGYNEAEDLTQDQINANTVWPHRWSLADAGYPVAGRTFDGKVVNDYACTSELQGYDGTTMCGVGTFCHEFGHVLGLVDLYDTSGAQYHTLDDWDIMDAGNYLNSGRTPPLYSCFERFYLGWLTPEQVSTVSNLSLNPILQPTDPVTNTSGQSYLLSATTHNLIGSDPNPKEYFMLEYRKKTGWDTYLPAEGMCIWHIDYDQTAWNNNSPNNFSGSYQSASSHMRVYLQPLSGSLTTPGTAFTSGEFIPTAWDGTNIHREITEITKSNENVSFKLMYPIYYITGNTSDFSTNVGTPSVTQTIDFSAFNMVSDLTIGLTNQTNFDIRLLSTDPWSKTVTISPVSGATAGQLQIRYNPVAGGTQTDKIVFSTSNVADETIDLSGTAFDPGATATFIGRIDNLLQYPPTKINTTRSKTINIKTTDIVDNLSLTITGPNASLFSVSGKTITKTAANAVTGYNITVNYLPVSVGTHTATLTISGGGLNPTKAITLSGEGI